MAAGFSLMQDRLGEFRRFLEEQFGGAGPALATAAELEIDAVISPGGINLALLAEIAAAGPFGAGNPEPLVAVPDARVAFADLVGGEHVKLRLVGGDGARLGAIAFRAAGTALGEGLLASRGKTIHAVGRLRQDDWGGVARVQLEIQDAAAATA
jgi:single-stranded-DNA-specific exonuclease